MNTLSFLKSSVNYSYMSWKNMLPAYSDTLLLTLLGAVYLEIASVVMISALTLNISLNTITNMLVINNNEIIDRKEFKFFLFKISLFFSIAYLVLAILAYFLLSESIKIESCLYLLLSVLRPIISCSNSYYREKLFSQRNIKKIHYSMNVSIALYIISSWAIVYTLTSIGYQASIVWFLIPTYISIFFNNFFYKRNIEMNFFSFEKRHIKVNNIYKSFNAGILNAFEIFFFALVAWVISIKFTNTLQYVYPFFNLVELASALALGINRVLSEKLVKKETDFNLAKLLIIYLIYAFVFVKAYIAIMDIIGSQNFSVYLTIFAVFYVFIDGSQLIYRSYIQVTIDEEVGRFIIVLLYIIAMILLALSFLRGNQELLITSIVFPVVSLIIFINGYNYVENKSTL